MNQRGNSVPAWSAIRDLSLSAWDLVRTRGAAVGSARGRVIALRTRRRLLANFEAQRGVPPEDRSQLLICDQADEACLLLPESGDSPAVLAPLARHLHSAGMTAHVQKLADPPTADRSLQSAGWRAQLLVARRSFQALARVHRRVHVVGHGFGATLAVLLARREPVSHLVLLAPALVPQVSLGQRLLIAWRLHRLPWIRQRMGRHVDLLESMEKARGSVSHLAIPIYAAQCDDDERVAPDSLRFVQKKARHQISRFRVFPNGGHAILAAHGEASLHREIDRFLRDKK